MQRPIAPQLPRHSDHSVLQVVQKLSPVCQQPRDENLALQQIDLHVLPTE